MADAVWSKVYFLEIDNVLSKNPIQFLNGIFNWLLFLPTVDYTLQQRLPTERFVPAENLTIAPIIYHTLFVKPKCSMQLNCFAAL